MSTPNRDNPTSFNFPDGDLLRPRHIDNLGRALISLTREICVLTDRQMVLEKILADKGIDVADAVDTYQPDQAMQSQLDERTGAIIKTIVSDLTGTR
ncbi:hypothetical protein [Parasphingorhabdus sp.]|uniref:hypothetical protein n=1 Tax=Parasphingorhabdus sp. TaxID=2709688 RepID=UPI003265E57E